MPDPGAPQPEWGDNPLLSESISAWSRLVEAVGPASILVVVESRMGERLKSRTTVEDIFQEVQLRAWRSRLGFEWRGLKSFRSWLLTIADNVIVDEVRKLDSGPLLSELAGPAATESAAFAGPVGTTTPSRVLSWREQKQIMQAVLDSLPEDLREVVWLRHFNGFEIAHVAQRLGIGESAVRHRLRKGLELYHSRLERELASRSAMTARAHAPPHGASGE